MIEMVDVVPQYLVITKFDGRVYATMQTKSWIIRQIDMDDCTDFLRDSKVYEITDEGPQQLVIHNCWHDFKDPLYIKVTRQNGEIVFDGYGTDH